MILALMLMLAPSDVTYDLTGVVDNRSANTLIFKSENVKPTRVMVTSAPLRPQSTAVFYNAKPSNNYDGSIEYATACGRGHKGTFRLSLHVTPEKNEGSCTYTGDAACQWRCTVTISPKSCRKVAGCNAHFTYTIGR